MAAPLSQVYSTARTLLNDDNASVWTDGALLPKVQEAHRELQTELWLIGSPVVRATTAPITIAPGVINLVDAQLQPADLLVPTAIYEATPGQTDWLPMTEQAYFAVGVVPIARLIYWAWLYEQILLVGATVARQIIIHYRKSLPVPTVPTSSIGILFGELYLAARTAALAAGSLGNQGAYEIMTALAKENLAKVIKANRGQQRPPVGP